jgi:hypothetical protein
VKLPIVNIIGQRVAHDSESPTVIIYFKVSQSSVRSALEDARKYHAIVSTCGQNPVACRIAITLKSVMSTSMVAKLRSQEISGQIELAI